ncbi:adenylate kinase family protein [Methanothermococcus okinawensis]|uniref:Putative adenylate kinase n=1 Tax=Methanothermococcus okinawensis (strain DSM 14208 / JCM 11175 / IH1) TaxID=647113 RepID=F8AKF5_METOI|nr:AAA family ATPase [Methanothermococcus okinawensis]AEH07481.1 Adenylate kinase [Methanothermococcus okinawensis IH1]
MINIKIAITGTPGVGKSTVSKLLVKKLNNTEKFGNFEYIDITDAVKEHKLYSEKDEKMDSYVVDFQKLGNYINEIVKSKSENLVIDGHVSHLLDVDYIVVLRCNPEIVSNRLKDRNYCKDKVKENVAAEILDVCLIGALDNSNCKYVYELDTTYKNVSSIVGEIVDAITHKKTKYGIVNWLDTYFYMLD